MGQQPKVRARVHPTTEQVHMAREGSRIGLVVDMTELDDLIDQLATIRDTWPLHRQIEQEQVARSRR